MSANGTWKARRESLLARHRVVAGAVGGGPRDAAAAARWATSLLVALARLQGVEKFHVRQQGASGAKLEITLRSADIAKAVEAAMLRLLGDGPSGADLSVSSELAGEERQIFRVIWSGPQPSAEGAQASECELGDAPTLVIGRRWVQVDCAGAAFAAVVVEGLARAVSAVRASLENASAETRVGELRSADDEQQQVLVEGYGWEAPRYLNRGMVHAYVEDWVRQTPGARAVVHRERSQSYAELFESRDRVSRNLRSLVGGATAPVKVAVVVQPNLFVPALVLGIFAAGFLYVPIDPETPEARLRYILGDAQPEVVIVDAETRARIENLGHRCASLSSLLEEGPGDAPREAPPLEFAAHSAFDAPAYVFYTSGSTGHPKGVVCSHRALANHMLGWKQVWPTEPSEFSGILACSLGFDVSLWEILYVLMRGGALHVLDPEVAKNAEALAAYLLDHEVTTACIRPAQLEGVVAALERRGRRPALAELFSGADSVASETCERFKRLCPELEILVAYGATENTIAALWARHGDSPSQKTVPIGRPLPGYRVYVVDERGELAPFGALGEIYIGGHGVVGASYLNRDELTRERFVADRFSPTGGSMYRTGDFGRFLPNGELAFAGRRDAQVKIRGVRVELAEVEAALRVTFGAADVAAVAVEEESGRKRLVAYLERPNQALSGWRERLADVLPSAMIPEALVPLAEFPRTASMKVDKKQLPPVPSGSAGEAKSSPETPEQRAVLAIVAEVLESASIGIDDDVRDHGLSSLVVFMLVDRINRETSVRIGIDDLRGDCTVRRLCERSAQGEA
jgi:amino acid adenylation domain-containing protein